MKKGPEKALTLERPGGRIAYDVAGTGRLVVCAPGMGDLRSVYRFLRAGLLEAGCQVATMDLRGHGGSDASFTSYDDIAAGSDLISLTEKLGGPAVLVGNSMSGGAAVWAAAERPDLVDGLVLIDPFVREPETSFPIRLLFRVALWRPWGPAVWSLYYASLYKGRPPADLARHRVLIRESMRLPGHWRAFVETTHTSHSQIEPRLREVRCPALVIMGERDPDFKDPAAEVAWVAGRLRGTTVIVPGAGHYPQAEYPEIVIPAVVRFLEETDSAAELRKRQPDLGKPGPQVS